MIQVVPFLNFPINSNCFVVFSETSKRCLIIDPGSEDSTEVIRFIDANYLIPDYVFPTHEHFDHIWGVKHMKKTYHLSVVCYKYCDICLTNPKKNMSAFFKPPGFSLQNADIIFNSSTFYLKWEEEMIEFYHTPGHTEGSICIKIGNYLFTGDTLIKGEKTVTKLPGGCKNKLIDSFNLLYGLMDKETIVFSGHGDSFTGLSKRFYI